ncbi:MAG: GlsB/YeaQ/YmgE family stress response membrane protein [Rhodothermales bacterium]
MWTIILIIVIGGLIGWVASKIMGTDAQQGLLINIVVGIVGALLAGFLLSPLLGVESILDDPLSIPAILISLVGAVILLAIVNFIRKGTARA